MKSGAQILIEGLKEQGVDVIFGYPGGVVLPIYDELYDSDIRHILVRHEQAAIHAADGYARASGKVGVCLATSGPGACNLVTGLATAYMDSIPVVALTGQVPTMLLGNDAFQESDITGITMPVTKHNYLVQDVKDLKRIIREAFYIAGTGRKGPVLIDIPKDVSTTKIPDVDGPDQQIRLRGYKPTYQGHGKQIQKAIDLLSASQRPIIYAGGGVISSNASAELVAFAERMCMPVATTLMGLGCIPADHPLNLGMLGMHGTAYANYAITGSDLLFSIGVRFDDRVTGNLATFAPSAKIIHIDIDPAEIGKNKPVDVPIVGDAKNILSDLLKKIPESCPHPDWSAQVQGWKEDHPLKYKENGNIRPQSVIRKLADILGSRGVIVSEVGQNQMWTAQFFRFSRPRQWVSSGGLGTMGFGFPAAMGAHYACPDEPVIVIAGDGSFQMNIQELGTVAQYQIPVKIIILNNQFLGMVRQWQELFYERRYSYTELPEVNFAAIAHAYGIEAETVMRASDVEGALRRALDHKGPYLLDFRVEREENVFPMVPAGAAISEMIVGKHTDHEEE
ncbi:MAG: biosynthetic-type acetolactate synthase large subunit [Methanobacteriota archaeon]